MKLLNHPLQVTQGDPSVHATEAGAVAFVGSTVTLAKCLVRRCLPVSVCWPLCRHEQMLMRNLVPSVCSRAIAHICDKGDNLAKQTLWLLLFLLATNQLFPLLVSGGRKNSSGLRSRCTQHSLYIVNKRVLPSTKRLILFRFFYIQQTQLL